MTDGQLYELILHNSGLSGATGRATAEAAVAAAICDAGKLRGMTWNSKMVEFNLTAGTSRYEIKSFSAFKKFAFAGIQFLFRSDVKSWPVRIKEPYEFSLIARGSTTVGAPLYASLYDEKLYLEFAPIPDSNYGLWGMAYREINQLSDIPDIHRDIILWKAVLTLAKNDANDQFRILKARQNYADAVEKSQGMSMTEWQGTRILPELTWANSLTGSARPTSTDLAGNRY